MTDRVGRSSGELAVPARPSASRREWRAASQWQSEIKRVGHLTDDEIALWRQLTETCGELRSPFFSVEFAQAVEDAGAPARICLLYRDGRLAGFFPFQFTGPLGRITAAGERIGGTLNDFCGIVADISRFEPIGAEHLLQAARLASFEVSHLEEAQPSLGLASGVSSRGARVRLSADAQRYWADVKGAHRSDYDTLKRRERKLEREFGRVEFVFAEPEPGRLLPMVMAAKREQYRRGGNHDSLAEPWRRRCLDNIAGFRHGRCVPVLSALYLDGEWAALHFGIRAGSVLHYWFPVYNERFGGFSPGLVLLARMIADAPQHGIDEIDLGEGLSRYKELFATEIYPVYRDVWYRRTPPGLANRAYLSLSWRARSLLRRGSRSLPGSG